MKTILFSLTAGTIILSTSNERSAINNINSAIGLILFSFFKRISLHCPDGSLVVTTSLCKSISVYLAAHSIIVDFPEPSIPSKEIII